MCSEGRRPLVGGRSPIPLRGLRWASTGRAARGRHALAVPILVGMAVHKIVLFYAFTPLPDPRAVQLWQQALGSGGTSRVA